MTHAFICDAVRTPIGRYGGSLAGVRADDLGAMPLKALADRNPHLDPAAIEEVFFGCANQAGEDNRNVARMSLLLAGLPATVPGVTLNRLCASGLEAVGVAEMRAAKERGSIEALLLNPVGSGPVVLGKIAAASVYGFIGVAVAATGFAVAVAAIPFHKLGLDISLSPMTALLVTVLLSPVVLLASALQTAVGVVSRTFKTAQSAISFVTLLPTLPGAALTLFPQQPSALLMLIPTVGHDILMMRVIRGESIEAIHVVIATIGVLVCGAAFAAVAVKLYGPRLVVGR